LLTNEKIEYIKNAEDDKNKLLDKIIELEKNVNAKKNNANEESHR